MFNLTAAVPAGLSSQSVHLEDVDISRVPRYFWQAWPQFAVLLAIEYVALWLQGKPKPRFCDTFTSLSLFLLQECVKVLWKGCEFCLYIYIHENYRLFRLPWSPTVNWYVTALLIDFGYYWVHRAGHEINVLWAQHQVHHSADDFNLTVGLRQASFNSFISNFIYTPLALVIPPAQFVSHQQFNLLYQVCIHTQAINSLGPLEWLFNTPQHHRVHHGCNKYLIDKNYGGVLIIFDRLFGTFQEKLPEDTVYGLVYPPNRFNPITLQTFYFAYLFESFTKQEGWINKLSTVFKGPSWVPGSPWTGFHELRKEIYGRDKFDTCISTWKKIFLTVHFLLTLKGFQDMCQTENAWATSLFSIFIIFSLSNFGFILENRPWAALLELIRCLSFAILVQNDAFNLQQSNFFTLFAKYLNLTTILWAVYAFNQYLKHSTTKEKDN